MELADGYSLEHYTLRDADADFHKLHREIFGYHRPDSATEIINLRTIHTIEVRGKPEAPPLSEGPRGFKQALKEMRPAYFAEVGKFKDTPVYDRNRLPLGESFEGPAIVEQPDTTTVIYPGHVAAVDTFGNLVVSTIKGQ